MIKRQFGGIWMLSTPHGWTLWAMTILTSVGLRYGLASVVLASAAHASNTVPQLIRYNLCELPSTQVAAQALTREASVLWDQKPLREGLGEISANRGISIWLDRRIDPSQPITFTAKASDTDRSLRRRLSQIASLVAAEALLIENVVYVGPRGEPARLQYSAVTLHDAFSIASGGANAQMRGLSWKELATPDDILHSIAETWDTQLEVSLPHDLFHAGELARPCTLATQLTLVGGSFSKRPVLRGTTIEFEDLSNLTAWQCTYARHSLNSLATQPQSISDLKQRYPGSNLGCRAVQCSVLGPTEFHLALLQPAVATRVDANVLKAKLTYEVLNKKCKTVIDNLAASIGLDIQWDEAIPEEQLERLISFKVEVVPLDELLQAIANASGLKLRRKGLTVAISP